MQQFVLEETAREDKTFVMWHKARTLQDSNTSWLPNVTHHFDRHLVLLPFKPHGTEEARWMSGETSSGSQEQVQSPQPNLLHHDEMSWRTRNLHRQRHGASWSKTTNADLLLAWVRTFFFIRGLQKKGTKGNSLVDKKFLWWQSITATMRLADHQPPLC